MENLEKDVTKIVAKVLKKPVEKLDPEANLFYDYGVDSLLGVEIFAALDKKYHIDVPEERIRQISTLNEIIGLIKEELEKKGS